MQAFSNRRIAFSLESNKHLLMTMEGAGNTPYRYRPLDSRKGEIRLLRLVRPEKHNDAPGSSVSVTIRHANLNDENLRFNALSYAWGAENPLYTIVVLTETSAHTIAIRSNLYDFLQTALAATEDWGQEWIWIDQICINQNDHGEKCQQVSQMMNIYPVAQTTLVWPGMTAYKTRCDEPVERTQFLFSSEELDRIRRTREEKVWFAQGVQHVPSPSAIRLLSMTTLSLLFGIYASPYWDRLWIIQEISLASRVRFILLNELWDFEDVHFAIRKWCENIRRLCLGIAQGREFELRAELLYIRFASWSAQRYIQQDEARRAKQNWISILQTAFRSECTEPLDYIYGLMGLVPEDLRVHPDYSILPREVLRAILQKQILKYCRNPRGLIWYILEAIIEYWREIAVFECIEFARLIPKPSEISNPYDYITENQRIEHNITLILQDLQIPIFPELDAARMRQRRERTSPAAPWFSLVPETGKNSQNAAPLTPAETPDKSSY